MHAHRSQLEAADAGDVPRAHTRGRRHTCREGTVEVENVRASAVRTAANGEQNARLRAGSSSLGRRLGPSDWILYIVVLTSKATMTAIFPIS